MAFGGVVSTTGCGADEETAHDSIEEAGPTSAHEARPGGADPTDAYTWVGMALVRD